MTKDKALALLNSILDVHVQAVGEATDPGAVRQALENARQDLTLHLGAVLDECLAERGSGQDLDQALSDAEDITRGQ